MAMEFDVLIEIPRGSRNKYEVDHESGLESGMKRESENVYRVDIVPIGRAQAVT